MIVVKPLIPVYVQRNTLHGVTCSSSNLPEETASSGCLCVSPAAPKFMRFPQQDRELRKSGFKSVQVTV